MRILIRSAEPVEAARRDNQGSRISRSVARKPQPKSPAALAAMVFALAALTTAPLSAQSPNPDLTISGKFDSSLSILAPNPDLAPSPVGPGSNANYPLAGDPAAAWTALGIVQGILGLSGGSKEVKTDLRLSVMTFPQPVLALDRATVRFRFPGLRGTLGLGRVAWGPGFVYVPGDLLFNSSDLSVNLASSEIRPSGTWLGDVYVSLADEAFVEAAVLAPNPETLVLGPLSMPLPYPAEISQLAGGARISAAPDGVTVEAAYAVDGKDRLHKIALSTQFNAGLDFYLSVRADLPFYIPVDFDLGKRLSASVGAFGTAGISDDFSLSTRHEALIRPWHPWVPRTLSYTAQGPTSMIVPDPDSPSGTAGQGLVYALYSYHDLTLALPDHFAMSLRVLFSPLDLSALAMAELDWSPLQNLRLYFRTGVQGGEEGDTYRWGQPGSLSFSMGAVASF